MKNETQLFQEMDQLLKQNGLKSTRQRLAILILLHRRDCPITVEEIYHVLKEEDQKMNLSTIYRTLDSLIEKGIVNKALLKNDTRGYFEMQNEKHQHHLVCMECKKMVPIQSCPFDKFQKEVENNSEFSIVEHKLELYGYCKDCK